MEPLVAVLLISVLIVIPAAVVWRMWRGRRELGGGPAERATFETLHTASLAAPPLRAGLSQAGAEKAARHLRQLLGSPALAITDRERLLVYDGAGDHHSRDVFSHAARTLEQGRTQVLGPDTVACGRTDCPTEFAVVVPLTTDGRVVGSLAAYGTHASAALVRAAEEVAGWVSGQLELAELDRSRTLLIEAEVRALRAQISPHFIYNSLTTIASFTRTDPERARELLLEFADFTRYSFGRHGEFTTLAEELRSIDHYLTLERARFGDRLQVTLRIAPEVLGVAVPFLCLQPLVENAVRHGLETDAVTGRVTILAEDAGAECRISVEDDGLGMDPGRLARILAGDLAERSEQGGVGLLNVDERLRQVYGHEYGLVVETALGAGTKVCVRLPKYHPNVSAR
ncbi:two-component system, LytT family, sensor kinase [Sinosporangium album]|uniref:Two-component system, LytT family, sensor kinase n=1 Tax=Sinosporangium album TaxID=504805 RepID=A0A1G7R3K5_9ACTN|nr:histidine kinase [Sinosporangium album]SDG04709.1 two-component system, LytT family, sensor kinase [Sinosporangium album]